MLSGLYHLIMLAGHLVCHQLPERSPHIFGVQLPLCWRCSGIVVGTTIFMIWLCDTKRLIGFRLSLALALLMPLDVFTAMAGLRTGINSFRFITGILWGVFGTSLTLDLAARLIKWYELRSGPPRELDRDEVAYAGD